MNEVTKKNVETILFKVDAEGFDYCFREYSNWTEETKGTHLGFLIKAYNDAAEMLENELQRIREIHGITDDNDTDSDADIQPMTARKQSPLETYAKTASAHRDVQC